MGTDGRTANGSHGNSCSNMAGEHVSTVILKTTDGFLPKNEMWHAEALPWECGNDILQVLDHFVHNFLLLYQHCLQPGLVVLLM